MGDAETWTKENVHTDAGACLSEPDPITVDELTGGNERKRMNVVPPLPLGSTLDTGGFTCTVRLHKSANEQELSCQTAQGAGFSLRPGSFQTID